MHSALVSTDFLDVARGEPGFDESGWVREQAHHAVRAVALGSLSAAQRTEAQRTALRHAASLGIAAVHECGGPGTSSEDDFTGLLKLSGEQLPEVYGFWGELMSAAKSRELGAVGAGGDLYADGALGSRTARVSEPYRDGDGCGFAYVTADQARDHLLDCAAHGVQGGFHAIGDEAVGDRRGRFRGGGPADRGGPAARRPAPRGARGDDEQAADRRVRRVRGGGQRAAGVRPAVGRREPDVRAAAGCRPCAGVQPVGRACTGWA